MRQEIGSNKLNKTKDIISVRVHLNGDAFVLPEVQISAEGRSTESKTLCAELITKRVMLMPADLFDVDPSMSRESVCRRELALAGIEVGDNEELLTIGSGAIVAAAPLSRSLIEELKGRNAGELIFDTPLLRDRLCDRPHVMVDTVDGVSFVKVYSDSELRFADVFETQGAEQIVYWLDRLSGAMSLKRYDLYILRGESSLSALSTSFNSIHRCE